MDPETHLPFYPGARVVLPENKLVNVYRIASTLQEAVVPKYTHMTFWVSFDDPLHTTHIFFSPSFCHRSWRPCEIALSASETVASATSKESPDLYACRGARALPGILRSPEEQPAGRGPAPPHCPAIPDAAPTAVWQPRPAPPVLYWHLAHAPLRLQDDR